MESDGEAEKENSINDLYDKNIENMGFKAIQKGEKDNISLYSTSSSKSIFSIKAKNFMRRCSLPKLPSIAQLMTADEILKIVENSVTRTCSFKRKQNNIHNQVASKDIKGTNNESQASLHKFTSGNDDQNRFKNLFQDSKSNISYYNEVIRHDKTLLNEYDNKRHEMIPSDDSTNHMGSKIKSKKEQFLNALITSPFKKPSVNHQISLKRKSLAVKSNSYNNNIQPSKKLNWAKECWIDTINQENISRLTNNDIKRQEAIHELYRGEMDTVEDLVCLKSVYLESMKQLSLVKNEEIESIFLSLCKIIPLHKTSHKFARSSWRKVDVIKRRLKIMNHDVKIKSPLPTFLDSKTFASQIDALRDENNVIKKLGATLYLWVPSLIEYSEYCSNMFLLRSLLETKYRGDVRVKDFLSRCQDSPFSRRLDIWSFIDLPRSHLVKYPLLLKEILKMTPETHEDYPLIKLSIKEIEKIISMIDKKMGQSKCLYTIKSLEFPHDYQKNSLLKECQQLICSGILKTTKGIKLTAFLFDKIFVMTRPSSFNAKNPIKYRVYKTPIPINQLIIVDDEEPTEIDKISYKIPIENKTEICDSSLGECSNVAIDDKKTPCKIMLEESINIPQTCDFDENYNNVLNMTISTPHLKKSVGHLRQMKIEGRTEDACVDKRNSFFDHKTSSLIGYGGGAKGMEIKFYYKIDSTVLYFTMFYRNMFKMNSCNYDVYLKDIGKLSFQIYLCKDPLDDTKVQNICIMERNTLLANDSHDKKLWVDSIRAAVDSYKSA